METWVCPNDRQLALRAKLGSGWSIHTNRKTPCSKQESLTSEEMDRITKVIKQAEKVEQFEMYRIGYLVDKLETMKMNALGDGRNQCVLCADQFKILSKSPSVCSDCNKNVCSKCSVETVNSKSKVIDLCKICSEKRELWRKSGAWFYKGLPNYIKPL
ncbi:Rabphilin, partial [Helobdella robusta]|uniref:Rabphilin n=1 Tax=Helobdella robusta TaxID=6412 RepID=T1G5T9_HELRO